MKAYVVGSLNMDLVLNVDRMPLQGETMFAESFFQNCGGKGANQAVACARLGADVSMVGMVGEDSYGQAMIENLRRNGVDVSGVAADKDAQSGLAFILVSGGDNRIILEKGANERLTRERVEEGLAEAREGDMLILQLEVPEEIVAYALARAKEKKMTTLLNPAPAAPLDKKLLSLVDLLVLNETEAAAVTGIEEEAEWMEALREMGVADIVLTLGEKGADVCTGGRCEHIPARAVKAVDTTAAGDTFIGAVVYARQQGRDLAEACRFASVASSITVTRKGASQSIPNLEEVLKVMAELDAE